jgi:hypothetical protein
MCCWGFLRLISIVDKAPIATIILPIESLADITQQHADTWNIVKLGYSKRNKNNSVELYHGAPCLVVRYPAGSSHPGAPQRPSGGIGFFASPQLIFPAHDVELKYKVAFDASFCEQKGGKLPGLYLSEPGDVDSRGHHSDKHADKHASCRLMWREGFKAEAYVYASAATTNPDYRFLPKSHYNPKYGDSLWRGMLQLRKTGWNEVSIRVRLNAPGAFDGAIFVSVNGTECSFEEMAWRWTDDVAVTSIFMSTFYSGSCEKFACPHDTMARFKDFKLVKWA